MLVSVIVTAAVTIVAAAFLVTLAARRAPTSSKPISGFIFSKGRLWASVDGSSSLALIDSGTSMSAFPVAWPTTATGKVEVISTAYGKQQLPVGAIQSTKIGGIPFKGDVLRLDSSYPIIGNDFIMASDNVLLSRSGIQFNVSYQAGSAAHCAPLEIMYDAGGQHPAINSMNIILNIDGIEQRVFFDTGNPTVLQGTALAPMPKEKLFPIPDITSNAAGQWKFTQFFNRRANILLDGEELSLPYQHYYTERSTNTPFIMGAGILNHFSVLLDRAHRRACFFKAQPD